MKWEWDDTGDTRVFDLWILREELSRSREVVYAKWYKGRATFFSKQVFIALLSFLKSHEISSTLPSASDSRRVLDVLEMDSPLSTKQLKEAIEMQGKVFEAQYNRAMKPLWDRLLMVGFGEMDDSSFPSLQVGATQTLFEELWLEAHQMNCDTAEKLLLEKLGAKNPFFQFAQKLVHSKKSERKSFALAKRT